VLNFARWVFREELCRGVPACPACRRSSPRQRRLPRILVREVGNGKAATVGPQALVPLPGSFNWASIAGGSLYVSSPGAGYQPQGPPNLPVGVRDRSDLHLIILQADR